jgi:hypothetical protein
MDQRESSRPADCGGFTIASQHAYFERWLLLLEKRYDEKFEAMSQATATALSAVEKQTSAAFAANRESVIKSEDAQKAYNFQHNDLTRRMEVQAEKFVTRERLDDASKTFDAKLEILKKDVDALLKGSAANVGRRELVQERRQIAQFGIGQLIAIVAVLVTVITPIVVAAIQFLHQGLKP